MKKKYIVLIFLIVLGLLIINYEPNIKNNSNIKDDIKKNYKVDMIDTNTYFYNREFNICEHNNSVNNEIVCKISFRYNNSLMKVK